ncbi:MAG: hypothetical protein AAF433_05635 [Bacteroidota bacterium]
MKQIYLLALYATFTTLLIAQTPSANALDRATLAATFLEGAQLIELSTAHSLQTFAFFDPNQLTSSTQEFVNSSEYYNWQAVSLRGFTDNRYLLQILQRTEGEGWELTHTDFANIIPHYEYAVSATRMLLYHLARPGRTTSVLTTVQGQLADDQTIYRARILQQAGIKWLELDQKIGDDRWQNTISNNAIFPLSAESSDATFQLNFDNRYLEIKGPISVEGMTAQMTYRFGQQNGQFVLIEVLMIIGEPCGAIEEARYRPLVGTFEFRAGEEVCSLSAESKQLFSDPRTHASAARRRDLSLGNLRFGQNRVRISGNRGDFVF